MSILLAMARKVPRPIKDRLQSLKYPLDPWMKRRISSLGGGSVLQGPFKGVHFTGYHDLPCLLGTYEKELFPAIERITKTEFTTVVDIGAASGFYVVGLARMYPNARVFAWEMTDRQHSIIKSNIAANKLKNQIEIRGECRVQDLAAVIPTDGASLFVVDVEGAELDLLDPVQVPQLRSATLIIETHDGFRAGCTDGLISRFSQSHKIEKITSVDRRPSDLPENLVPQPRALFINSAVRAMSEMRMGPQEWLVLTPNPST